MLQNNPTLGVGVPRKIQDPPLVKMTLSLKILSNCQYIHILCLSIFLEVIAFVEFDFQSDGLVQ